MKGRVTQFGDIVRRDRRRHPDRDALRTVGEEIGKRARQHHRLVLRAVVGRPEIDRVFVDAIEQQMRNFGQPRFGVTHSGGIIAVHIAEVPLPIHQGIALGEILSQTHERVIHRLIAVRMKLADDIADDASAFLECRAGVETQQLHRVQEPPVNRLETVACIRQRPAGNGGERVLQIALFQRVAQRNLFDFAVAGGISFVLMDKN